MSDFTDYPNLSQCINENYDRIDGMHSLGFVAKHRPDIHIITDKTETNFEPVGIVLEIETALKQNKKVGLWFWDEDFIMTTPNIAKLDQMLQNYRHESVYLCSNMDGECLLTYQQRMAIKILHIPTWWFEMIRNWLRIRTTVPSNRTHKLQYACYVNNPQWHKKILQETLMKQGLGDIGDIRWCGQQIGAGDQESCDYYQQSDSHGWHSSHDMKRSLYFDEINQVFVDHNIMNTARLQTMLGDIPLVIHSESNLGIFPATEKTLWPILLNRLMLIQARPRFMQWLGQYLKYDFGKIFNLEHDRIDGWDETAGRKRTEHMIDNNRYVITHAHEVRQAMQDSLANLSQSVPSIVYKKFCDGLNQIQ